MKRNDSCYYTTEGKYYSGGITEGQEKFIIHLCKNLGEMLPDFKNMSKDSASDLIERLRSKESAETTIKTVAASRAITASEPRSFFTPQEAIKSMEDVLAENHRLRSQVLSLTEINARLSGEINGLKRAVSSKNFTGAQSSLFNPIRSTVFWDGMKTVRIVLSVVAIIFLINHYGGKFVSSLGTVTGFAQSQQAEPAVERKQNKPQTHNEYVASVPQSQQVYASQPEPDSNYYQDLK